jgi:hypothetical protein
MVDGIAGPSTTAGALERTLPSVISLRFRICELDDYIQLIQIRLARGEPLYFLHLHDTIELFHFEHALGLEWNF